ncbi:MAG: signal peptidase II [Gammaproteobacteria bacterium]|nr:signal peptidase II [Gammaproteobacteria bacterium]
MLRWLWLSLAVLVIDQITKQLADALLTYMQPVALLPLFNFTLMYNSGAAFSFLSDAGGWQRWFFTAIALTVSTALVIWITRLQRQQWPLAMALALILGGAIGNLIDRLIFGHVIDFIDIYYQQWHWPAFNVADAAISIGAALLLIDTLFGGEPVTPDKSGNPAPLSGQEKGAKKEAAGKKENKS